MASIPVEPTPAISSPILGPVKAPRSLFKVKVHTKAAGHRRPMPLDTQAAPPPRQKFTTWKQVDKQVRVWRPEVRQALHG